MTKKKKESILIDDVSRQIAETKKVLADAQKSLAEKTAEVSNLKARLKQLEKSANLPDDTKSFAGKWFKSEDGTSADKYCTNYYYVVKPVAVLKDRTFSVRNKVFIQQFLVHRITTF